jgi:tetratricopeptide (TPR) repeat protein
VADGAHRDGARGRSAVARSRAGELARAGGDLELAERELALAVERLPGSALAARARLELGNVQRRAGDERAALATYEESLFDPSTPERERGLAWYWRGRSLEVLGDEAGARRSWREAASAGRDPPLRARACDRLARSWIRAGDGPAAASVVARCREELAATAAEATELGRRTRSALERMLAPRMLDALEHARSGPIPARVPDTED